jgi:hypothetical protein
MSKGTATENPTPENPTLFAEKHAGVVRRESRESSLRFVLAQRRLTASLSQRSSSEILGRARFTGLQ